MHILSRKLQKLDCGATLRDLVKSVLKVWLSHYGFLYKKLDKYSYNTYYTGFWAFLRLINVRNLIKGEIG